MASIWVALGLVSVIELLVFVPLIWPLRRVLAAIVLIAIAILSSLLFVERPCLITGLFVLVGAYRIFNMLRIVENRMQRQFLHRVTMRTSLYLLLLQLLLVSIWRAVVVLRPSDHVWWLVLGIAQLTAGLLLLLTMYRQVKATLAPQIVQHFSDHDLPTLTVCVPARNETEAMTDCLRSIIASDYPKLEVLVLDDCSQDRTSDIVRDLAHEGVRFIKGTDAPMSWLAKNWAYKRLFDEANGELLIFCGVDIRFESHTLRSLVVTMLGSQRQMISLLPRNVAPKGPGYLQSSLLQPMRYAWELCLPRTPLQSPPVLSSCWIAERGLLQRAGGFAAASNKIVPESYFAQVAAKANAYSFLQTSDGLAVSSLKDFGDQWDTAVRTRYPQLHRRPELVLLVSLGQITGLLGPFLLFVVSLCTTQWLLALLSGLAGICVTFVYVRITQLAYQQFVVRSLWALPFAVLLDISIRHYSMWRYEFSDVIWKGRNVCLPVMHVIPHLPRI
jgi:hypothetical protein